MITFKRKSDLLLLIYKPEGELHWLKEKFLKDESIRLNHTFTLSKQMVYGNLKKQIEEYEIEFVFAKLEDEYYHFDKKMLGIKIDLYIYQDIKIEKKFFVANRNISIFRKIEEVTAEHEKEIKIGKTKKDNLPLDIFQKLLKSFPTTTELNHYANMRMEVIIKDYLEPRKDYQQVFNKYMNTKNSKIGEDIFVLFDEYEANKYQRVLDKLNIMLEEEEKYTEKQWQREILQIIRLIYPKYIAVFENVKIRDVYKPTNRYLDFMLVDANGNIDLVEIKKPFGKKGLVTTSLYRDNHVPVRELSGSIMQIEKYIFYLNKWGKDGEEKLSKKYASDLPTNFKIKVTNPSALIIMGRNYSMNSKQQEDFEIIKRKYKNVIDILTYDDLVNRLENTIAMFRKT